MAHNIQQCEWVNTTPSQTLMLASTHIYDAARSRTWFQSESKCEVCNIFHWKYIQASILRVSQGGLKIFWPTCICVQGLSSVQTYQAVHASCRAHSQVQEFDSFDRNPWSDFWGDNQQIWAQMSYSHVPCYIMHSCWLCADMRKLWLCLYSWCRNHINQACVVISRCTTEQSWQDCAEPMTLMLDASLSSPHALFWKQAYLNL